MTNKIRVYVGITGWASSLGRALQSFHFPSTPSWGPLRSGRRCSACCSSLGDIAPSSRMSRKADFTDQVARAVYLNDLISSCPDVLGSQSLCTLPRLLFWRPQCFCFRAHGTPTCFKSWVIFLLCNLLWPKWVENHFSILPHIQHVPVDIEGTVGIN